MNTAWRHENLFLVNLIPFSLEHLSTPVSNQVDFSPSVFPINNLLALLSSQFRTTFSAHLTLFYLKSRIMFSDQYGPSLRNLQPPALSSLSPNIFRNTLYSNTPSLFRGGMDMYRIIEGSCFNFSTSCI